MTYILLVTLMHTHVRLLHLTVHTYQSFINFMSRRIMPCCVMACMWNCPNYKFMHWTLIFILVVDLLLHACVVGRDDMFWKRLSLFVCLFVCMFVCFCTLILQILPWIYRVSQNDWSRQSLFFSAWSQYIFLEFISASL